MNDLTPVKELPEVPETPKRKFIWNSRTMWFTLSLILGTITMNYFGVDFETVMDTFINLDWNDFKTALIAFGYAVIRAVWTKAPIESAGWKQLIDIILGIFSPGKNQTKH